jgi:hypothetical protein
MTPPQLTPDSIQPLSKKYVAGRSEVQWTERSLFIQFPSEQNRLPGFLLASSSHCRLSENFSLMNTLTPLFRTFGDAV